MPDEPEIAVFVLLVLPGLIFLGSYSALTPTREKEIASSLVGVIAASIICYLLVELLHIWFAKFPSATVLLGVSGDDLATVFGSKQIAVVGVACMLAVALSLVAAIGMQREWIHRLCRLIGLTRKSGFSSHWDDVAHSSARNAWVSVCFKDGEQYVGWLKSHSDGSEERSLLLCSVRKYTEEGDVLWDSEEMLFVPQLDEVRSIRIRPVSQGVSNGRSWKVKFKLNIERWWDTFERRRSGRRRCSVTPARDGASEKYEGLKPQQQQAPSAASDGYASIMDSTSGTDGDVRNPAITDGA